MSEELRTCGKCAHIAYIEWAGQWVCTSSGEYGRGFTEPYMPECPCFEERSES